MSRDLKQPDLLANHLGSIIVKCRPIGQHLTITRGSEWSLHLAACAKRFVSLLAVLHACLDNSHKTDTSCIIILYVCIDTSQKTHFCQAYYTCDLGQAIVELAPSTKQEFHSHVYVLCGHAMTMHRCIKYYICYIYTVNDMETTNCCDRESL